MRTDAVARDTAMLDDPQRSRAEAAEAAASLEPVEADESSGMPAWFQRKAKRGGAGTASGAGAKRSQIEVPEEPDPEPAPWRKRALLWVTGFAATGYGLSLLFHAGMLTGFAFWYLELRNQSRFGEGGLIAGLAEEDTGGIDFGPIESKLEEEGGQAVAEVTPEFVTERLTDTEDPTERVNEQLHESIRTPGETDGQGRGKTGEGTGRRDSPGSTGGRKRTGNAVTKGSFTVWTEPEDPAPGEAYHIHVEIDLTSREDLHYVRATTIHGSVVGTDGWSASLPEGEAISKDSRNAMVEYRNPRLERGWSIVNSPTDRMPVVDGFINLRVMVLPPAVDVSASGNPVRDTIFVGCKLLDERQKLEIEF